MTTMPCVIVIFAYNRSAHLFRCISTLLANEEARNFSIEVFIDGPKSDFDVAEQKKIIYYLEILNIFENIKIYKRKENTGLSRSIIAGLRDVFSRYEAAIIIEDDLEVSPYLLEFFTSALNLYKDDSSVASIHGFSYPLEGDLSQTYFLKGADCWGWATWRNRWAEFEEDAQVLIDGIIRENAVNRFDLDGNYAYFKMLKKQSRGEIDSWAIRWHASMFLKNKFTLFPRVSLVENKGMDGSGTHYNVTANASPNKKMSRLSRKPIKLVKQTVIEDELARESLKRFLLKKNKTSKIRKLRQIVYNRT